MKAIYYLRFVLPLLMIAAMGMQNSYAQCGTANQVKPVLTATSICSGTSITMSVFGLPVTQWIYRDNGTGSWQNAATTTSTTYTHNFGTTVSSTTNREYRAVVSGTGCPSDTTMPASVVITPSTYGNSSILPSGSNSTMCSGTSVYLSVRNDLNVSMWLYKDNGTGAWNQWTSGNPISSSFTTGATVTNRQVRAIVYTAGSCSYDTSQAISFAIQPRTGVNNPSVGPVITTAPTICSGGSVTLGVPAFYQTYSWLYRNNSSSSWTFFTSGSNPTDNNTTVSATTTREYKVVVTQNGSCTYDTSASVFATINIPQRGNNNSLLPATTSNSVCSGTSVNVSISNAFSGTIVRWLYRDNNSGNWTAFSSTGNNASDGNTNLSSVTNRAYRVIVRNASLCREDTSAEVMVTIRPRTYGTINKVQPLVLNQMVCSGFTAQLSVPASLNVQNWLYRNNGGSWTYLTGSTTSASDFNTTVTTQIVRDYMVLVNDNSACTIDSSAISSITIKPTTYGSNAYLITPNVNNATVCSGNNSQVYFTLNGNYSVLKWIYKDNSGSWLDNTSTSTSLNDFSTTVSSQTNRTYKAIVRNNENCIADSTQQVSVNITPRQYGTLNTSAAVATNSSICAGTGAALSITLPSGYTVFQWYRRDNGTGSWSSAGGGNSINDFNTSVSSNTVREYRVVLQNASQCRYDTTAVTQVNINVRTRTANNTVAPQLSNTNNICSGKQASMYISLPSGTSVQKWIYRDGSSGAWLDVSGSSASTNYSDTRTYVLVNTSRNYRVIFNYDASCSTDTSAALNVNIMVQTSGTVSSITPASNLSNICSGTSVSINNSSVNSTDVIRWYYRNNSGPWIDANNSSTSHFDGNTQVSSNTTRSYRQVYYRANSCIVDTTSTTSVNINARGVSVRTVTPSVSPATACAGTQISVVVSTTSGDQVVQHIYRDNGGAWQIGTNSSSSSYTDANTDVTASTTRNYRTIFYNSNTCTYDSTLSATVTINPYQRGSIGSVTPTVSNSTVCAGNSISLSVNPGSLTVKEWMYRDNSTGVWLFATASATSFSPSTYADQPSNISRQYRVLLASVNGCNLDTSAAVSVTINKRGNGYVSTQPVPSSSSICNTTTSTAGISLSTPSGYSILRWQYRDGSAAWNEFAYGTTSSNLTDYSLNVNAATTRQYRAIITTSGTACSTDTTALASINIYPLSGGILNTLTPTTGSTSICYGQSPSISVSMPSGYSMVKWIYKDNSGAWKDFNSSTSSTNITDNNTYVQTALVRTYYAVMQNSTNCRRDTSLGLSVTLNPPAVVTGALSITPTSTPASGICSGGSLGLSVNPGSGNTVYKWSYFDLPSGTTYDILSSNNSNVNHLNTLVTKSTTRLYKAIIRNNSNCRLDSSSSVWVNINRPSWGTDTLIKITGPDTICANQTLGLSVSVSGTIEKWMYQDNGGNWNMVPASAGFTSVSDNNTNVSSGVNRKYFVLVYRSANCKTDTSMIKDVYIRPRGKGTSTIKANISLDTVCVGTNTLSASISASTVIGWVYRENFSGAWNAIPSSASVNLTHNISGITVNTSREYRAIVLSSNCSEDTTSSDTVLIKTISAGNFTGLTPTSGNNVSCNGSTANISVSPGSGNTVVKWIYRNNNSGPWFDFQVGSSTSIADYNTYVTTPQTRVYRVIIRRNCGNDTTDSYTLSLLPRGKGNDTTVTPTVNNSTICTGSSVTASISLGSGKSVSHWIYRNGSGSWNVLAYSSSGSVADNYTIVGTTTTRQYAAIIYNTIKCSDDTSKTVSVTINPVTLGNVSTTPTLTNSTVCVGNTVNVSITPASGGSVVGWLYNVNGGSWNSFGYTTSSSIADYSTNYSSTTTRSYRALIYTTSPCKIDTSASVTVTITPRTFGNDNSFTLTAPASSCSGSSINVGISSLGSGNTIQSWIYRNGSSGSWNYIYSSSTSISDNNTTVSSTTTRTYRALIVKGNACTIDTSNGTTVTINAVAYGNDNTLSPSGTSAYCTGASVPVSLSPGSGNSIYGWIYRQNNSGVWQNYINYSVNSFTDYNTYVSTTTVKSYRALVFKPSSCKIDTSAEATATINPRTYGNVSTTPTAGSSTVCSGSPANISISLSGGTSVSYWLYRDNSGSWNTLSYSSSGFTDYNTNVSSSISRSYRAIILSTSCSYDTSNTLTITISPRTYGNLSTTPTLSNNSICSGTQLSVQVSVASGSSVQQWLYRNNSTGVWLPLSSSSGNTYYDYNTTVSSSTTRSYRALIVSGTGCTIDTSAATTVTMNPIGTGNSSSTPNAGSSTVCVGSTASVSMSSGNVVNWLYRDNSSGAWIATGAAGLTYFDYNTNVSSNTSRAYRAIIFNSTSCSYDTTASAGISINLLTAGNSTLTPSASNSTVCAGNVSNVYLYPTNGYVQSWLSRDGSSGAWTALSTSSGNSINDYNTSVSSQTTREYRAIIRNLTSCSMDTSAIVSVTIKPIGKGTDLTNKPQVSAGMICSLTPLYLNMSNGYVQNWMYRDDVTAPWTMLGAGNYITHSGTFTSTPINRMYRALVYNSGTCSVDTSDEVKVMINPNTNGNTLITPATALSNICSGTQLSIKLNGYFGTINYWLYRDNGGVWNMINSTSDSIVHLATTVSALTNREYRAIVYSTCRTDSTLALNVTIDVTPALPIVTSIAGDTLMCNTGGVTYKWIRNGVDIPGATSQKFKPTQNGSYVVEVSNTAGCKNASVPYLFAPTYANAVTGAEVNVEAYPNPTSTGKLTVSLKGVNTDKVMFTVINMLGQPVMLRQAATLQNGSFELNLEEQARGVYFIIIEAEGVNKTKQLIYR